MKTIELKFDVGDKAYLIDEEEIVNYKTTYYRIYKAEVEGIEINKDKIEYLLRDKRTEYGFRREEQYLFKTRSELMVEIERMLNDDERFD